MTHTEEQIAQLLSSETSDSQRLEVARELMEKYPYFILPALVALKHCRGQLTEKEQNELSLKVALSDPEHACLFDILSARAEEFRQFYPAEKQPGKPTTEDAIDTFLRRYGSKDNAEETELLERLIFNPVPDYASVLEQEASGAAPSEPADSQDALIDEFIRTHAPEKNEPISAPVEAPVAASEVEPSPDSLLSESLAKFHIHRQQYDKALEIIQNLSVSHPKESAHYETQIRFLKKLIKNQKLSAE